MSKESEDEVTVLQRGVTVEVTVEEITVLQEGTQHGGSSKSKSSRFGEGE